MRRLFEILRCACFFLLCYAAVPLIASQLLLGDCRIGLLALLALLPVSFLLALIPGKIGGGQREEAVVVRASRGSDPDPDKGLRNEALPLPEKRSFPLRAFCCLLACIAAAAGMYMLPIEAVMSAAIIKRVVMAIVMAVMLPMALRVAVQREEDGASMTAGVIMYILSGGAAHFIQNPMLEQWLTFCAIGFLLFCAFGMNDNSMSRGAAVREGVRPPLSMRRRNRLMLGVIAVIGGLVLYFDRIREWTTAAAWWCVRMTGRIIAWLFNLGAPKDGAEGVVASGGGGQMNMGAIFGTSQESAFWAFVEKIMFVIVILAVVLLLCLFGRRIWRILLDITRRLIARLRRLTAAVSEEYQDEQESLFDWGETTKELGEGISERLKRLMKREKRWEQMELRERMRYILRSLYRRSEHPQALKSLTAREAVQVISTGDAQPEELAQAYDQARYGQLDVDEKTVERLRKEAKV